MDRPRFPFPERSMNAMQPIRVDSVNSLLVQVSRQMHEHGWALLCTQVEGWLYHFTVGLEPRHHHPDLEVIGLDEALAQRLLTVLVGRIRAGERYRAGDIPTGLVRGYDLLLVNNPSDLYGPALTGRRLRLVWPDPAHRYPWHEDCDPVCASQRLIPSTQGLELDDLEVLLAHTQGRA
jgi:hypothetical protein